MKAKTKVHQVFILPTKKESTIAIVCNELCHVSNKETNPYDHKKYEKEYLDETNHTLPQHIYFTSDEPVTSADTWVIFRNDEVVNIKEYAGTTAGFREQCKKIVATTDNINSNPEEEDSTRNWLPNIDKSFVEFFIKSHVNGKAITEVHLEMKPNKGCCGDIFGSCFERNHCTLELEIRNFDNTVIVHPTSLPIQEINMTPLETLIKNNWWESGVRNIKELKAEIEKLDKQGIKKLTNIHTITHSHAIAYFVSFGFKETTAHTIEGTKTTLEWK